MNTLTHGSRNEFSRRRFLANASALSAASLIGYTRTAAAEPPPEIQKIRLAKIPGICMAPEYVARDLLQLEGFTEVEYAEMDRAGGQAMLFANRADVTVANPADGLRDIDAGKPLVLLAGLHGGCYELFANERVRALRDLKGKRVAVSVIGSPEYYLLASMMAYVGVDPRKDIDWVLGETSVGERSLFLTGKADAILVGPPVAQDFRAKKIGRVILNIGQDRPWDQYYCCMIAARPDFVRQYPVATKRAVRAILKAADICANEPERAARSIVDNGFEPRYEVALEVLKTISYDRWRTHDPEDTLRFYGLRLHDVGMVKTAPIKLIAQGTDWRFLTELKNELKA